MARGSSTTTARKRAPAKRPAKPKPATTSRSKPAPARKATTPRKRPPRKPTRSVGPSGRAKGGPVPMILKGFDRKLLRPKVADAANAPDPWTENAPARRVLMARRCGATIALAAASAKIHTYTIGTWIARGREAIGDGLELADLEASGLDDEALAAAAFYVFDQAAEAEPAIGALTGISRATEGEWRAGLALLRVLPATKRDYSEVQKLEHSGPDGDAIPISARAQGLVEALEMYQRGAKPKPDAEEDDGAGDG